MCMSIDYTDLSDPREHRGCFPVKRLLGPIYLTVIVDYLSKKRMDFRTWAAEHIDLGQVESSIAASLLRANFSS